MDNQMLTKLEVKPEGFPTHITHIGFLPSVDSLMYNTVRTIAKAFATLHTFEGFLARVASLMPN